MLFALSKLIRYNIEKDAQGASCINASHRGESSINIVAIMAVIQESTVKNMLPTSLFILIYYLN